ncbi:MAG: ATP-binding protein [Pseudonocardiaceae bacterium]
MAAHPTDDRVRIDLLGRFRVHVGVRAAEQDRWPSRRAEELVQLLALADGHRLLRDQVIDALWPHLDPDAGAANLRKAAHHARQALGDSDAVVLRAGQVALFPSRQVDTDVERLERAATAALRDGAPAACAAAAGIYTGELLPDSLYEEWTQTRRDHLRLRHIELLRRSGQSARLFEMEPTDEPACRELMRTAIATGNRHAAIRCYGRLRTALQHQLGLPPGDETVRLYEKCVAGLRPTEGEFIGRQVELATATAALESAEQAAAGALILRGPPGIGKSTLCGQVASVARGRDWVVITVAAAADSGPYAPLVAALEQLLSRDRAALDRLPDRARSVLAELTIFAAPAPPFDDALTRHQVIGAFRRLLEVCAAPGVVLVVDDAHLADDATTEALTHLADPHGGTGLLVVLAYRSELARAVLARGVARLDRAGIAVTIDLLPLDRHDAAALVEAGAPTPLNAAAVAKIVELAQGNPFFILELARAAGTGGIAVPRTVWDAVTARFLDLDDGTTAMLQRLAVAGDELEPADIVAVTGLSESDAFALLDSALDAEALVFSGTRYSFRHGLVRQALVQQVPPHRRIAVHRDAARRLASAGGTPAVIARHWLEGGKPDHAVDWLLAAARHAVRLGAFGDALGHLEPLLDHAPGHSDALCLRAEVLDALGDRRAPAAYATAAQVVGEPASQEIRCKEALARLKFSDPRGALATLRGVTPTTTAGRLCQALTLSGAAAVGYFGDADLAVAKAEEAYRLAVELGEAWAVLDASWSSALAAHAKGGLPARLREYLHSTHELPELATRVFDGQLCVTQRLLYGGLPYGEVITFADSLAAEAQRLGAARGHAFALTLRGEAKLLSGHLNDADTDLAAGARLHGAIGAAAGEALALQRRAEVAMHRGSPAEAAALVSDALATARDANVGHHTLDRIYGTMVAAAADHRSALRAVDEAESAIRGPAETCPTCRITFLVPAAVAAARGKDLARARRYAHDAEIAADVILRLPGWYAAVEEIKGHLAQATGNRSAASAHFRTAADGFGICGQPLDEARCAKLATTP